MVFVDFFLQEVVEVARWSEIWRVWWEKEGFVAYFMQFLVHQLCGMWPGIVGKNNGTFSIHQCRAKASQFVVHFANLLTICFCCEDFAWIHELAMNQTGWQPPNCHHGLPLIQLRLWGLLKGFTEIQSLCWMPSVVIYHPFSSHVIMRSRKWIFVVTQKKRRAYFLTTIFVLFSLNSYDTNLPRFFNFPLKIKNRFYIRRK